MQEFTPPLLNFPGWHGLHSFFSLAYLPAIHVSQFWAPELLTLPVSQLSHMVAPSELEVPGLQSVQAVAPVAEYLPGEQLSQLPPLSLIFPALQLSHLVD